VLRCFLPNLSERTRVIHELHTAINRSFSENGIEIPAVPQELVGKSTLPLVSSKKGDSSTGMPRAGKEPEAA
jgi:small-conductance mechanosensitive channel